MVRRQEYINTGDTNLHTRTHAHTGTHARTHTHAHTHAHTHRERGHLENRNISESNDKKMSNLCEDRMIRAREILHEIGFKEGWTRRRT